MDYEAIKQTATEIIHGVRQIYRLHAEGEQGRISGGKRNVEASCILGTSSETDLSDTSEYQAIIQERLLEDYAKHEKIWYDHDTIRKKWNRIDNRNGAEAEVYLEKNRKYVRKVFHYINSDTPLEFIDNRISLHNSLFPPTKYKLIGFTRTIKGFAFIIKQVFIIGRGINSGDNLSQYMKDIGFPNEKNMCYWNDILEIGDLHEGNVLKDKNDEFYFIDTIPCLKDKSFYQRFSIR